MSRQENKSSGDNSVAGVTERKQVKKFVQAAARGFLKVGDVIRRNGKAFVVVGFTAAGAAICQAQTDATAIATQAQSAFAIVAPITITIAAFYVIIKIAKRTVK